MAAPAVGLLALIIFIAGFIDSIAGGGGLITVPAYLLFGLSPLPALGTNKVVSSMGTSFAVFVYHRSRRIPWRLTAIALPFTLCGAWLGARTVQFCDPHLVRMIIILGVPLAAVATLLPRRQSVSNTAHTLSTSQRCLLLPLIAGGLGWYDGFFGPGTGSLLILALHGLLRLSLLQSAAMGRAMNLASNIAAAASFLVGGFVVGQLVLPLTAAAIAGNYCGSHLAIQRGDRLVRVMLAGSCGLLVVALLWQQLQSSVVGRQSSVRTPTKAAVAVTDDRRLRTDD